MKKIIILAMALAFMAGSIPMAHAGDTATLDINVTFKVSQPVWVIEPQDGTVKVGKTIGVDVLANDPEGAALYYSCRWWLNGVEQPPKVFPVGAIWTPKGMLDVVPNLTWKVPADINTADVHEFMFTVYKDMDETFTPCLSKKIRITVIPLVISITLNDSNWALSGVKLNEWRTNYDEYGAVRHVITNEGDVAVGVDIGYIPIRDWIVHPGTVQGLNTFVTKVSETITIPTEGNVGIGVSILPGNSASLKLAYGAPTEVSQSVESMYAEYELRAYSIEEPTP